METHPLDLAELARESLNFLRPRLKNVELDTAGLAHPLPILGDKSQLEQIIINLLLNGLESMKFRGRLSLEGMTDTDAEGHPTAVLRVRDSGPGIAPEARERVFDLFYTTRSSEGFGIGLFVSRRIAERHGGTLRAESHPEGGAVMVLTLPAAGKGRLILSSRAGSRSSRKFRASAEAMRRRQTAATSDRKDAAAPLVVGAKRAALRLISGAVSGRTYSGAFCR